MPTIKIDKRVLNLVINRYLDNSQDSFAEAARDRAQAKVDRVKRDTLQEFDEHAVTQDVAGGPRGGGGVLPFGNLFSFIGFDADRRPVANLRKVLVNSIRLRGRPRYNRNTRTFEFTVELPDRDDIVAATEGDTPEWGGFESWAFAMEEGFSGLSHYLYKPEKSFANSLSGPAIQTKNKLRGGDFFGTPYISEILKFARRQF